MGGWRDDRTALAPLVASAEGEKLCLERLRFLEKLGEWQFGEVRAPCDKYWALKYVLVYTVDDVVYVALSH